MYLASICITRYISSHFDCVLLFGLTLIGYMGKSWYCQTMSNQPITGEDTPDPWMLAHDGTYYLTMTLGNRVEGVVLAAD